MLKAAGVKGPVARRGAAEPETIYAGVTKTADAWLIGILNNGLENQSFTAKIQCLPPGEYSVVDITGQRPLLKFTAEKSWYLEPDPDYRREKYLAAEDSAEELAGKGIPLDCVTKGGRILLVRQREDRPVGQHAALRDDRPVLPVSPQRPRGGQAARRPAGPRARPRRARQPGHAGRNGGGPGNRRAVDGEERHGPGRGRPRREDQGDRDEGRDSRPRRTVPSRWVKDRKDWYVMDVFHNEIVDTDGNLIVIGNENSNRLVKQLGTPGAFAYDKVLVKVTDTFPGNGIGVLQVVESVNSEAYDCRHESRTRDPHRRQRRGGDSKRPWAVPGRNAARSPGRCQGRGGTIWFRPGKTARLRAAQEKRQRGG